jgi:hypothetical protein
MNLQNKHFRTISDELAGDRREVMGEYAELSDSIA